MPTTEGKVAVVTGGASGIGRATCVELARQGYRAVAADLDLRGAQETVRSLSRVGFPVFIDVTDADVVEKAFGAVKEWAGVVDLLVNCAGIGSTDNILNTSSADWHRVFSVNVTGIYHCCRAALPNMIERGNGCIINVASVAGLVGIADRAAYCASKGAVIALTRAMAIDHVSSGIRVSCVCPGTVESEWVQRLLDAESSPAEAYEAMVDRQPMGRMGTPAEIASAIAYLAGDSAAFITGSALVIDGGWTAR